MERQVYLLYIFPRAVLVWIFDWVKLHKISIPSNVSVLCNLPSLVKERSISDWPVTSPLRFTAHEKQGKGP